MFLALNIKAINVAWTWRKLKGRIANRMPLLILFLSVITLYCSITLGWDQRIQVFLATFLATGLIAYIPSKKLVDWIHEERYLYMLELKAEDGGIGIWRFHPGQWKEIEIINGKLHEEKVDKGRLYVCREFDESGMEAKGTWMGSASDLEFLREKKKIEDTRKRLESLASESVELRASMLSIVREAIDRVGAKMAQEFEKGTLYQGEEIGKVVGDIVDKKCVKKGKGRSNEGGQNE